MKKNIPISDGPKSQDAIAAKEKIVRKDNVARTDEKEGAAMTKIKNKSERDKSKPKPAAQDADAKLAESLEEESADERPQLSESELTDQLRRLAAEFDNYRKKNAGEFSRGKDAGIADAVSAILPAMDSIASALCTAQDDHSEDCLAAGVQAVERQILSGLTSLGITQIEVNPGDELDPNLHEVMLAQDSQEHEPGKIIAVMQQGYAHRDKLLRAAKVIVSKDRDD